MPAGTYQFGPSNASLLVKVFREGMARKVGHDLIIEVKDWRANVVFDAEDPTKSSITGSADVGSFQVIQGTGGVKALTDEDKADIKDTILTKILTRRREISFRSTSIQVQDGRATGSGELTVEDTTHQSIFS